MRKHRLARVGVVAGLLLAAASASLSSSRPAHSTIGPATPHLAVILLENKEYSQVIGNSNAPYLNGSVIPAGRLFSNYYGAVHPSLPGYLVLTAGQYGGCVVDTCPARSITADNIFAQMNRQSLPISWKVYAESMPSNCYAANLKGYLVRHNPAVYYANLGPGGGGDNSCATQDVPYSQLSTDLANNTLPAFSFVVPNQYNDMHTDRNAAPCQLGSALQDQICQGDTWLQNNLPALLSDGGRNDVTVLVGFDEGSTGAGGGGHIVLVEMGPNVCAGCTDATAFNHYGLLDAIETWFGLPGLKPASDNL